MMQMKDNKTRALIIMMTVLVFAGIVIAWIYYGGINRSVDPRIRGARELYENCLLYTSPSPRDRTRSRMPSSA